MSPPDGIPPGRDAPGVGSLEIARQPWQGLRLFLLIPMSSLVFPEETKAPRRLVGFAKQQDTPGYDFTLGFLRWTDIARNERTREPEGRPRTAEEKCCFV